MSQPTTDTGSPAVDDVEALRWELAELRDRVDILENQLESSSSTLPPVASDYRDARVLEALDVGDVPTLSTLRTLYEERTDISDDSTLRDRVKHLVQSEAFEEAGSRRWRYLGPAGEHDR